MFNKKLPKFLRILRMTLIAAILIVYGVYASLFYRFQREMLYPGGQRAIQIQDPASYEGLVAAHFPTSLGPEAGFAWYLEPPASSYPAPALIIGHGNGEIADDLVEFALPLQAKGFGVLIIGYPGYGHAKGSPTKETILEAAVGSYDWLIAQPEINADQIVVMGLSLGGAAAWEVADKRPTKGAMMLSTFASIRHSARDRWLPGFLAKDQFDNLTIAQEYDRPVYLMHGTQDLVIRPHHARKLHAAAKHSELQWLDCGHGSCIGDYHIFWDDLEPRIRNMISD